MSFSKKNTPALSEVLFLRHQKRLLLTQAKQRELIGVAQKEPEPQKSQALQELIFCHLPFIIGRAKEKRAAYPVVLFELMDFVELAILGFIKGVQRFDLSRQTGLLAYANWWINQVMLDEIKKNGFLIQYPEAWRLVLEDGSRLSALQQATWITRSAIHLDQGLGEEEEEKVETIIADPKSGDWLEKEIFRPQLVRKIVEQTQLTSQEAFVLEHRLLANQRLTLQQCGRCLRVSTERARKIEVSLIRKLRQTAVRLERGVSKPKP